jgi:hypothetical protein
MFQTKSASKRETVSTGPAQVWKPMTGASEAELRELPLRWQESNVNDVDILGRNVITLADGTMCN